MLKAIIFDFNGTLFNDSALHEKAWILIAKKLREKPLEIAEFYENLQGRDNLQITSHLLGYQPETEVAEAIAEEKEALYRQICKSPDGVHTLAVGAESFLNTVQNAGIPIAIATGSYLPNVQFYFQFLGLGRWFSMDRVVFDDGTYPGKPAPDVYLKACKTIDVQPHECLVFEDSYAGVRSANAAGIGRIITVEPRLDQQKLKEIGGAYKMINGFEEAGLELLKSE